MEPQTTCGESFETCVACGDTKLAPEGLGFAKAEWTERELALIEIGKQYMRIAARHTFGVITSTIEDHEQQGANS